MKKKLFKILISIFMIFGCFPNVISADGLGDTPTIEEIASTRPDFVFGNNNSEYGWINNNQYKLWFDYGPEYLCLSYGSYYSNEIKVLVSTQATKDGNNYKVVTTDGVNGGNIDIVFVMNANNILDYIEVTAPNSPDVGGKYGRTIKQILNGFPDELESAWTNGDGYGMYHDSNNSCLKIEGHTVDIEIPNNSILHYSENKYTYKDDVRTIVFDLYFEPEANWAAIKNITVSGYGYGTGTLDGTYSFLHAGDERWIGLWGDFISSTSDEKEFKIKANDDVETFTIIEALDNIAEGAIFLPDYAYDTNGFEYYITNIGNNVFEGFSIFYLEIDGDHLEYIGDNAFKNCSNLNTILFYSLDTPPTLGTGAFDGCSDDLVIYVSKNSYNAYKTNSTWSPYKDRLIPFYLIGELIDSNPSFPRWIEEVCENPITWKNDSNEGVEAYYEDWGEGSGVLCFQKGEIYYYVYPEIAVTMNEDGNFEYDSGEGPIFKLIMADDVLTSIEVSGMENYDPDYSVLNGTYQATVTIADILPSDFPTTVTSGWVDNDISYKMYHDDSKLKVYMNPSVTITLSDSTVLTKDGNNYTYTCDEAPYYTLIFKMNGSNLQAVDVTISPTTYTFEPYQYTNSSISVPVGYTGNLEFATNAVYTNDTDVTVKVDGTLLTLNDDYTLSHGSTHVKLNGDYVKTLSVGTHTITVGVTGYEDINSNFLITSSSPGSTSSKKYTMPNTGVE